MRRIVTYVGQLMLIAGGALMALAVWLVVLEGGNLSNFGRLAELSMARLAALAPKAGTSAESKVPPDLRKMAPLSPGFRRGDSREGVFASAGGTGVVFTFDDGRRVRVAEPEGLRLDPVFHRFGRDGVAVVLHPDEGIPLVGMLSRAEGLGTALLTDKLPYYEELAGRISARGSVSLADRSYAVSDVRFDARGVIYCLRGPDHDALAAARLRRGVFVQALLRAGCGGARPIDYARLEGLVGAVLPDRWR